jgi:hypothetical protein
MGLAAFFLWAGLAAGCPVTPPPQVGFVPPAPFPSAAGAGRFYLGNEKLWISNFRDWSVVGLKTEPGYRVKFPWFSADLTSAEDRKAELEISGRRLDGEAPPLIVEGPNVGILRGYRFFASALIFPAGGCWEVTARRKGTELTFVVSIP